METEKSQRTDHLYQRQGDQNPPAVPHRQAHVARTLRHGDQVGQEGILRRQCEQSLCEQGQCEQSQCEP